MLSWFPKPIHQMNLQDRGQLSVLLHHTSDSAISKIRRQETGNQFEPNAPHHGVLLMKAGRISQQEGVGV